MPQVINTRIVKTTIKVTVTVFITNELDSNIICMVFCSIFFLNELSNYLKVRSMCAEKSEGLFRENR